MNTGTLSLYLGIARSWQGALQVRATRIYMGLTYPGEIG